MRKLLAHASALGVQVHVAHLPHPYMGFYDSARKLVVYGFDLTPVQQRSVLAHELGHAYYDHTCADGDAAESAADLYAAQLLIDPAEFAKAERIDPATDAIAEELGVTSDLVHTYKEQVLTRVRGATYARPRLGRGQYAWRGFS